MSYYYYPSDRHSPVSLLPSDYYARQQSLYSTTSELSSYYYGSASTDSSYYINEQESQSPPGVTTCLFCGEQFTLLRGLVNHLRTVHDLCHCFTCNLSLETVDDVMDHLQTIHLPGATPESDIVSRSLFVDNATYHDSSAADTATFRDIDMEGAESGSSHIDLAVVESSSKQKFSCDICHRDFVRKGNMERHKKRVHSPSVSHSGPFDEASAVPNAFECTECNRSFKRKSNLYNHVRNKHNRLSLPSVVPDMNNLHNHCDSCNRTYSSRNSFGIHLRSQHKMKLPKLYYSTKSQH